MSMNAVAKVLNEEQVPTPSGKGQWQHVQVARVYKRLEAAWWLLSETGLWLSGRETQYMNKEYSLPTHSVFLNYQSVL